MSEPVIVTAEESDPQALDLFLRRFFKRGKCDFLLHHGAWWHREPGNRLVATLEGEVAGYCAVVPTRCLVAGQAREALWWVDLIVAPEFRGQGIQTLLDRRVLAMSDLLLGFPNHLAAKIHRKHGWGVLENHRLAFLPLDTSVLRRGRRGISGAFMRFAALIGAPAAMFLRWGLSRYRPRNARRLDHPDATSMASIFERHPPDSTITTYRDAEYFRWRYFEAPYWKQLGFYVAGNAKSPKIGAVTRALDLPRGRVTRLLDLFGDLDDRTGVTDLLRLVARDAAATRSAQLTAYLSDPRLKSAYRSAGLVLGLRGRSCWYSSDPELRRDFLANERHWCLADSDNDSHD